MDHQSMQPGAGDGSGAATQEGAGGRQPAAQVVDGTFLLMELLEDAPATEQPQEDVDQLKRVIQSLEAKIDGRPTPANGGSNSAEQHVPDDVDGGLLLDDMLSESDHDSSTAGPCVATEAMPPFEYWAEGHDMGGWYHDGVMVGGYYEFREQCYYGCGESLAVDQVYSPLWE